MKKNYYYSQEFTFLNKYGKVSTATGYKVSHTIYGVPRFVFHYLALDLDSYGDRRYLKAGFEKYRAKWFGGGLVVQMYGDQKEFQRLYNRIHEKER